jgi:alkylation response protein AidB-like acyl-CoA dehydrogenase
MLKVNKGLSFLSEGAKLEDIFTPEDFTDEHKMIADMAEKFVGSKVVPRLEEIEKGQFDISVKLLKEAGELGLLGLDVPEDFGGMNLDKVSSSLISEKMARGRSFSVTYGGQVGIGSLPIVYFGTQEQKRAYLPDVVTADRIGAYALTEPTSGTDALAAKTIALLSDCKKFYILNGEKQFITNSAFADFFIVFAKIDRDKFTAFIVDGDTEGISTGPEEKKMGLKGSSTRSLILENVKVPVGNVLGEVGKGHLIAFNILNIGRHKISASCLGTSKQAIELAVKYAKDRKQFGQSLSYFPLIKQKIADMAVKTYVNESMVYRTAGLLDSNLKGIDEDGILIAKAIGEYATECSINKVFSSEALDWIIDEAVQIHGGYGFIADYEVETLYRDSRVNRIFEGTNEINRILIATNILRKTKTFDDQFEAGQYINDSDCLTEEKLYLHKSKILLQKIISAINQMTVNLHDEQEILIAVSDTAIDIYAMESAILRAEKAVSQKVDGKNRQQLSYTQVYVKETIQKLAIRILNIYPYISPSALDQNLYQEIYSLMNGSHVNVIYQKRDIANNIINIERYTV